MAKPSEPPRSVRVTPAILRRMPLPQPGAGGDKNERGRVLIVGGAREMPGAIILAATAALRAGAGKLQVATAKSIAPFVALALPEARVFGLLETGEAGDLDPKRAADAIAEHAEKNDAVLLGPGMVDENGAATLALHLAVHLARAGGDTVLVLDAAALLVLRVCKESPNRALCALVIEIQSSRRHRGSLVQRRLTLACRAPQTARNDFLYTL